MINSTEEIVKPKLLSSSLPKVKLSDQEFITTRPIFTRSSYACFGEFDDPITSDIFSRTRLRTPPKIREQIVSFRTLMDTTKETKKVRTHARQVASKVSKLREEVDGIINKNNSDKKKIIKSDDDSLSSFHKDDEKVFFFSENDKAVKIKELERRKLKHAHHRARQREHREKKKQLLEQIEREHELSSMGPPSSSSHEIDHVKGDYCGIEAKKKFSAKFHNAQHDLAKYTSEIDIPSEINTPRTLFLREQAKRNLLPLPLIMRRENQMDGVHLRNKGLGDERILPLITMLQTLPSLDVIDLCDNRLTDVSLMPLALKLSELRSLTHLDLSFNKIDESSGLILDYLRGENCRLKVCLNLRACGM